MTTTHDDSPDAIGLTHRIELEFLAAMTRRFADPPDLADRLRDRVLLRRAEVAHLIRNELDAMNVGYTLLAVAAFDLLAPEVGEAEAIDAIDACLHGYARPHVLAGTRAMLDASADPYATLVAASRERELHYFGPSFAFDRPIDDGFGYVLEIRRCLYHEVLAACGRTELQPLMCRADTGWIDAIDPARHRLRFVRPSTLVNDRVCRMWFMRTDGDDRVRLPVAHGA